MKAKHSLRSDSWGTPGHVLDRVRLIMNVIDFDPASSHEFNLQVRAYRFLTAKDDGLTAEWPVGNVYCNPPGGKRGNRSMTQLFWSRLMQHRADGNLVEAIFMASSLEAMQSTQGRGVPSIAEFMFCIPAKRLAFVSPGGLPGLAPAHSNCIVYVPGIIDSSAEFKKEFSTLGVVR